MKVKVLSKKVSFTNKNLNMVKKYSTSEDFDAKEAVNYTAAEEDKRIKNVKDDFQEIVEIRNLYNCNWCAMTSISPKGLEKHKHRKHSNETQELPVVVSIKDIDEMFPSSLCDKLSKSKAGLRKHRNRKHKTMNRQDV